MGTYVRLAPRRRAITLGLLLDGRIGAWRAMRQGQESRHPNRNSPR
jgi:hypothetical protein